MEKKLCLLTFTLLNVGPDYLGRIPAPHVEILKEIGRRLRERKEK